jgi:hypothetical protein
LSIIDTSSPAHVATVHYADEQTTSETRNKKQALIQQFYTQLEQMKATFNNESMRQLTTNTLVFDNGQVQQRSAVQAIKEKSSLIRPCHISGSHTVAKPPLPTVKARSKQDPLSSVSTQLFCFHLRDVFRRKVN